MTQNQARSRHELLLWIDKVSFMAYEMVLYLDTHPNDQTALDTYQKYDQMRRQALQTYASQFGPLTLDTTDSADHWTWATQSWPWEGGNC